jgi:hypothetical protein
VSIIDDLMTYATTVTDQARHPIFNAQGREIGYYDTLDALCQGQWKLYSGEIQPPVSQLYVGNFWGQKVPLATQCAAAAAATAQGGIQITQPQPVTAASADVAVSTANTEVTGSPDNPVILPPVAITAGMDPAQLAQLETWAIWGMFGLVGAVILFSPSKSGKRR